MKLELKNIEVNIGMSEETYCYSASLWVDGKRAGTVGNHGHGGCDEQNIEKGLLAGINAWIANNLPPAFQHNGEDHPSDLEIWCSDQITEHLVERDFASTLRRRVLFVVDGGLYMIQKQRHDVDTIATHIKKKHGAETQILNSMDRADALKIFKELTSKEAA